MVSYCLDINHKSIQLDFITLCRLLIKHKIHTCMTLVHCPAVERFHHPHCHSYFFFAISSKLKIMIVLHVGCCANHTALFNIEMSHHIKQQPSMSIQNASYGRIVK